MMPDGAWPVGEGRAALPIMMSHGGCSGQKVQATAHEEGGMSWTVRLDSVGPTVTGEKEEDGECLLFFHRWRR